ncbi:MAG TPA: hypothetical protein PKH19_05730, partial [Candidatus Syntrophosphaera sp.]|nr:hypothetical protein [Candidatus Syntrophosphaera sp.]
GTALMEFKTRKKIVYRIKNDSACTYEIDDTPPFPLNREALNQALRIALLLNMKIVGELHITRKQYLDGSIPTGFQRTTILGIEGQFSISTKPIRVIQFSLEEDSCREVSDLRHTRVYYADRLGMPLIETVTYPDMETPWEASEAAQHIRFIARSSGLVRVGIGAARQDVNVSIDGGTRVEIKGVAHIAWIPKLTHNEAFRQKSLLLIRDELAKRKLDPTAWKLSHMVLDPADWRHVPLLKQAAADGWKLVAVNLPGFMGILSYFNEPGRCFADELADRLKVIPCLEKPNMLHSEQFDFELLESGEARASTSADHPSHANDVIPAQAGIQVSNGSQIKSGMTDSELTESDWQKIRRLLKASDQDAQLLFWAPDEDIQTALETIFERCQLSFTGVPNETRKSLPDGITLFERVLPGADRMYPDTDSAPIPILDEMIENARKDLPTRLDERLQQLAEWSIPPDAHSYLLRNNLMPVMEKLSAQYRIAPKRLALYFAHLLKGLQGRDPLPFDTQRVEDLLIYVSKKKLVPDILPEMLKVLFRHPNMQFSSVLATLNYKEIPVRDILAEIPSLAAMWERAKTPGLKRSDAMQTWMMGRLRYLALGNILLAELRQAVEKELSTNYTN